MKYNDDYNNIDNQTGNYDYGYEDGGRETANTGSPQPNPELLNNAAYTQQKAASPANPQNQKNSTLGVWALILSILGCTFFIGAILAIIDITKKDGRKKTLSIIALCFAGLWIITIMTGRFRRNFRDERANKSETTATALESDTSNMSISDGSETTVNSTSEEQVTEEAKNLKDKSYEEMTDDEVIAYERTSKMLNKFDSETNTICNLGGYQFEVPAFFGKANFEDEDQMTFKIGEKTNEAAAVAIFVVSDDQVSYSSRENNMNALLSNFSLLYKETEENTIAGFNAYILNGKTLGVDSGNMFYSQRTNKGKALAADVEVVNIYDEENNNLIVCFLFQTLRTNFDYSEDFMKMCDSFKVAEKTGVSDDFKAMMDAYEEFIDEYIAFMNKYNQNPSDMELMSEYFDFMTKYAEYADKIAKLEDSEMTDEEAAYYLEVTTRVANKLAQASLSY